MTPCERRNRGSALVMVIGLLAMILLLGTTFLLVSQLDARQSTALAQYAPVPGLAEGELAKIVAALRLDRYVGAAGPYSDTSDLTDAGISKWFAYVDAAIEDTDKHLASMETYIDMSAFPAMGQKRKVTNLHDAAAGEVVLAAAEIGADRRLKDADGDEKVDSPRWDSLLQATGVTDLQGVVMYVSPRVTDQAARICINTAADGTSLTVPLHPSSVNLAGLLGGGNYATLHKTRCDGSSLPIANRFDPELALRVMSPATAAYTPFTGADELFLRWLGGGATSDSGPLYDAMPNLPVSKRRNMTVYSASNTLVRHPVLADNFRTRTYLDTTTDANRQATYSRMVYMLAKLGIGAGNIGIGSPARKRMAASFVANLWAYQSAGTTKAWAFQPASESFIAYGLIQRLVITEAYAYHNPDMDGDGDGTENDYVWGCAIELMNPTGADINLSTYKLYGGPGMAASGVALSGTVAKNGGKIVLYNWGDGGTGASHTDVGFPASVDDWKQVAGMSFVGNGNPTIRLTRTVVDGGATHNVPVDQVSAGDLGYNVPDVTAAPAEERADIRRDDDLDRARYNVAAYKDFSSTGHALGNDNGLTTDDLSGEASFSVPIVRRGSAIASIGECMLVYLTGPMVDGTASNGFPVNVKTTTNTSPLFGDIRVRGRLDPHPASIADDGYSPGDDYPDVPAATLLSEFFTLLPADDTRGDELPFRVYGLININTATREVLEHLPWPTSVTVGSLSYNVNPAIVAEYVLAYRLKRMCLMGGRPNYATGRSGASGITGLRTTGGTPSPADAMCFLTPGEIAVPLADYANYEMKCTKDAAIQTKLKTKDYIEARDAIYRAVANVVTVRSDVYAVNIRVQLGSPLEDPVRLWYYVAVVDRGNCLTPEDIPAILLFSRVK